MTAAPDERALEEWVARAIHGLQCERIAFPYPWDDLADDARAQYLAEATALTPLLEVVAAARAWRRAEIGAFGNADETLWRAVDALERAMGERSDG